MHCDLIQPKCKLKCVSKSRIAPVTILLRKAGRRQYNSVTSQEFCRVLPACRELHAHRGNGHSTNIINDVNNGLRTIAMHSADSVLLLCSQEEDEML